MSRIPLSKIPLTNIHQDIALARGRKFKEGEDVTLPSYMSDQCIVKALKRDNYGYLEAYMKISPCMVKRYYYVESFANTPAMTQNVVIAPLLGYAFLFRALGCIDFLLGKEADPNQRVFFLTVTNPDTLNVQVNIHEVDCLALISGAFIKDNFSDNVKLFMVLKQHDVQICDDMRFRRQIYRVGEEVTTTCYQTTVLSHITKELEKVNLPDFNKRTKNVKILMNAYENNELETAKEEE